ncbi:MAG: AAA family ATPase, partial [Ignavibacteriaceae bacterium]|nr:AAA family ATPase [Ignavibacteriaceae bacterium]
MLKKRLPSKTSNYADLIESGMYYVDKTAFIQTLESISDKYLFFLRPRRFGKSLTISMLEHYYGVQYKEKFDALFGGCFIGRKENSTQLRNEYRILKFNFSGIRTDSEDEIFRQFNGEIEGALDLFMSEYNLFDDDERSEIFREADPVYTLRSFLFKYQSRYQGQKIYLVIDEYDHFTNELFSFNTEHFKEIVTGNGWVRKFYEVIKMFMGQGVI